jgi:hypothetical protein
VNTFEKFTIGDAGCGKETIFASNKIEIGAGELRPLRL